MTEIPSLVSKNKYEFLPLYIQPKTIKNRIEYIYNIIRGNITLKPGQIDVINKKCDIKNYIKNIGGEFDMCYCCT